MAKKRDEIDEKFKWSVEDIFKNVEMAESSISNVNEDLKKISSYKGKLSDFNTLLEFFIFLQNIKLQIDKLSVYSSMKHNEDGKNDIYNSLFEKVQNLDIKFNELTSWVDPEVMSLNEKDVLDFISSNEKYNYYYFYFERYFRMKKHILDEKSEYILSLTSMIDNSYQIFNSLLDSDIKFDSVLDSNGKEYELTHATYGELIRNKDRILRKNCWETYNKKINDFSTTLTNTLSSSTKSHYFYSKIRNYKSCLERSLFYNNIPLDVYYNLIKTVKENLIPLHKYMEYRKKKLNLDKLHFYDLYVSLIDIPDYKITYDEARNLVLESVKILGDEYYEELRKGLYEEKWVDVYENENKRSGAYSTGSYLTKPYILMNWIDNLESARTLAHEAGHSMHTLLTNKNQPAIYEGYSIFLAEVASTFNEELFNYYLLNTINDKKVKAYIINTILEDIRATLYRQTLFAEFELKIHEMVENDIPLTKTELSNIYKDLYINYYGDNLIIDELLTIEWSRIPHFYYNFYVYQYATGISSSIYLFNKVINGTKDDVEKYLNFLKSGSSDYPINILKKAGVDLTTPEPIVNAINYFDKMLDEMIKLENF